MSVEAFCDHYYLKEELIEFCRNTGLSTSGSKSDINERIIHYLRTGEALPPVVRKNTADPPAVLSRGSKIEENVRCSEKHRAFFKEHIGEGFKFNVEFMEWLRSNAGRTYDEAIVEYGEILERKKTNKTTIGKQFEYNTYIRDFFSDNRSADLDDAIVCWKYKKGLPGHNKYEPSDKVALEK